jgi:hypothetical protein
MNSATRGSTSSSNVVLTLTNTGYNTTSSTITYPGFPLNQSPTYSGDFTVSGTNTTDLYSADTYGKSGFYLQSNFTSAITGLPASTTMYTLNAKQQFSDKSASPSLTKYFYVDALSSTSTPSITEATITNNSTITWVTGVPMINAWSFDISNIVCTNIISIFSKQNPLWATFNSSNNTLLNYFIPNSTTVLTTLKNITGSYSIMNLNVNILNIYAKSIYNTSVAYPYSTKLFVDPISITLATTLATLPTTISTSGNTSTGQLLSSPSFNITSTSDLNNKFNGSWTPTDFNHATSLTTTTNNLQIVNGYFVTPTSVIANDNAYKNYTGYNFTSISSSPTYPNYSTITDTYRWATFKWTIANTNFFNTFSIQINFEGTDKPTISINAPYLNNIIILYRFEEPTSPIPSNIISPGDSALYSTTWINAGYLSDVLNPFSSTYALTDNTYTYGGITNGSTDLNYITNNLIISNLKYPNANINNMNVYVSIGLQMSTKIAFNSVICNPFTS